MGNCLFNVEKIPRKVKITLGKLQIQEMVRDYLLKKKDSATAMIREGIRDIPEIDELKIDLRPICEELVITFVEDS